MKRAIFHQHGKPEDVIELIEEPDPQPGAKEVRVRNHVMTINPADLLTIEGHYGAEPTTLPCTPGTGAYGIVDAVGEGVKHLAIGDCVVPVGSDGMWADTIVLNERMAPKAPDHVNPEQAAMMRANPATAYLMLTEYKALDEGDWVVQNAANSSVGRSLIRFAETLGLHTVNIVRRDDVTDQLKTDGADAIIVDDGKIDLTAKILEVAGKPPALALDAIGGNATAPLAASLKNGGVVVVYGLLSGENNSISARDLVFRDISVHGFWLSEWYNTVDRDDIRVLNQFLTLQLAAGNIYTEVQARYPLEQIKQALADAACGGRHGKILLTGHGNFNNHVIH